MAEQETRPLLATQESGSHDQGIDLASTPAPEFKSESDPLVPSSKRDSYHAVDADVDLTKREVWLSAAVTLKGVDMPEQQFRIVSVLNFFWREDIDEEIDPHSFHIPDDIHGKRLPIDQKIPFQDYDEIEEVREASFSYDPTSGVVRMELHVDATLTERLELARYPLDRQFMNIEVDVRTQHWKWLRHAPDWAPNNFKRICRARLSEAVAEYRMLAPWITIRPEEEHGASVRLRLRVERHLNFFMCNIILPSFLLVSANFAGFAIDVANPSGRLVVSVTLMLAAVAFRFVVSDLLPKVSYLTLVDWYLGICFFMVGLIIMENGIAGYRPVTKVAGYTIDAVVFGVLLSFWILFHIAISVALTTDIFKQSWEQMDREDEEDEPDWLFVDGA